MPTLRHYHANHPARLAALSAGDRTWLCDVPCSYGHLQRYTNGSVCVECSRRYDENAKRRAAPAVSDEKPEFVTTETAPSKDQRKTTRKHTIGEMIYHDSHSVTSRKRSDYLDGLVKKITASLPKVPSHDIEDA